MIEPEAVLRHWGMNLERAERLGGTNNVSWRIEAGGSSCVLRLYQNLGNLPHVAYEHELLLRLARMDLSFNVPAPLPSSAGRTLEPVGEPDQPIYASLSPLIPGRHPIAGDPGEARASGRAIGELDAALQQIDSLGNTVAPLAGRLATIHPLVPNPLAAILEFEIEPTARDSYAHMVERTHSAVHHLFHLLPCQVIHWDIARSNMLIDAGRVTGILDFEFAAHDLRVLDPAIGVQMFSAERSGDALSLDLDLVAAFSAGYRDHVRLTPQEIHAVPDVLRLRSAVSVIHRLGRWRAGLATVDDVSSRIREGLLLDAWLTAHKAELLDAISK